MQTTGLGAPAPNDAADDDAAMPDPQVAVRRLLTEDWAATILGLLLLALAILGVIGKGVIP